MHFSSRFLAGLLRPVLNYLSGTRLPQTSGSCTLPGLESSVTVQRDRWGIPHIHAAQRHDLYFAQGFVHAQDRLWQLEVNRRAANGRLAELVGVDALETDRLTRTLGFHRLAAATWSRLPASFRGDIEAYSAGINAFMTRVGAWPIEFSLLRHTPEPWTPLDTIAFARLQQWALSVGWSGELVRAQLSERIGLIAASELEPDYPERNPLTLPRGVEFNQLAVESRLGAAATPPLGRGFGDSGRGSNGWVIAARRSATGHALLCNDLHLPVATPGIWYFNHLRSDDGLHVTGVSQPGLPYVLVGHNEAIAWGATLAYTDVEDLFIEQMHPDGSGRYRFQNGWRQGDVREELIHIRGQAPLRERVFTTHHGPLISTVLENQDVASPGQALALCSVALQAENGFEGFPLLSEARDWESFVTAAQAIAAPTLNLLYVDRHNNTGHYVTGRVPLRGKGQGLIPAPGWEGDYDWVGAVPAEEMPHAYNPADGVLVTCNQRLIDDTYPHFLGAVWVNGNRARRITELLATRDRVSAEECARIQQDLYCAPAAALCRLIAGIELEEADARLAQTLLTEWNGWLGPGAVGGSIYAVFLREFALLLLEPALGRPLLERLLGLGVHETLAPINEFHGYWPETVLRLLRAETSVWIAAGLGRRALLERALNATMQTLRARYGPDPRDWQWGRLHQIRFRHLLGRRAALDAVFSLGPFPMGGDTDTVLQSAVRPGDSFEANATSVSYRQIIDVSDWDRSTAMLVPGQSGHLASPHYDDLVIPWLEGTYFPMHWSAEAVAGAARETLILQPAAASAQAL